MTSRITRATFTVVGFAGLVLIGLLIGSLNAERANAQRTNASFPDTVSADIAEESPRAVPGIRFQATQLTGSEPSPSLNSQPYNPPSAVLMQPIVVAIKDGPQLRGEPVGLGALPIKTIFGPVSIPVNQLAGVRTADDVRQPATICLSNGDSLTGVLSTDSITIKTAWGTATIACDHIASIVTAEQTTWQQHEGRWRVIPVEPVTRATEAADSNKEVGGHATDTQPPAADSPTFTRPPANGSVPTEAPEPELKRSES